MATKRLDLLTHLGSIEKKGTNKQTNKMYKHKFQLSPVFHLVSLFTLFIFIYRDVSSYVDVNIPSLWRVKLKKKHRNS